MGNYDIAYVFKAIDDFSPALKKINESMANFEKQTKKAEDRFSKFSEKISSTGKFLLKSLVVPLAGAAVYAYKNAEQFEQMKIRLEAVTGSAANAAKVMESIKQMSMATGISPEILKDMATKLLATKVSMEDLPEKMRQMSMFAVVAKDKYSLVEAALTRMRVTGGATSRTLVALSNAGIPLLKELNLSTNGLQKLKGKTIGIEKIESALKNMTREGSSFYESYKRLLMTTGTSADRIHQSIRFISSDFGDALLKVFGLNGGMKDFADKLSDIEPKIKEWLSANPDLVKMITYASGLSIVLIGVAAAFNTISKSVIILRTVLLTLAGNPAILALLVALTGLAKVALTLQAVNFKGMSIAGFEGIAELAKKGQLGRLSGEFTSGVGKGVDAAQLSNAPKLISPFLQHNVDITGMPSTINLMQNNKVAATIQPKVNTGHYPMAGG